jgi:hypothetical protein
MVGIVMLGEVQEEDDKDVNTVQFAILESFAASTSVSIMELEWLKARPRSP